MYDDNELRRLVIRAVCNSLDSDSSLGALADDIIVAIRENYAIVRLPEPEGVTENTAHWDAPDWWVTRNGNVVLYARPQHHINALSPYDARAFAAALLAAVDAAEAGR